MEAQNSNPPAEHRDSIAIARESVSAASGFTRANVIPGYDWDKWATLPENLTEDQQSYVIFRSHQKLTCFYCGLSVSDLKSAAGRSGHIKKCADRYSKTGRVPPPSAKRKRPANLRVCPHCKVDISQINLKYAHIAHCKKQSAKREAAAKAAATAAALPLDCPECRLHIAEYKNRDGHLYLCWARAERLKTNCTLICDICRKDITDQLAPYQHVGKCKRRVKKENQTASASTVSSSEASL